MKPLHTYIAHVLGEGFVKQDIVEAGLEIAQAETDQQLLAAAKRLQNFVNIAARGTYINENSRISAALAKRKVMCGVSA